MAGPWDALGARVHAMHQIWTLLTADLTAEQVNHHERTGVLPITFSLVHYVSGEDRNCAERLLGSTPIWSEAWATRTGIDSGPIKRGTPIAIAEQVRVRDYAAWLDYQQAVFTRTEQALATMAVTRWDETVFETMPDHFKGGFIDLLVSGGRIGLGDLMDALLYQHGMRHIGEIEHARSLVGLQGAG